MFIAQIIATPLGILAAVKQNSVADSIIVVFTMIGASVPGFWLALMLIQWFAIDLHWVPSMYDGSLKSWILPIVSITFGSVAATTRGVRTNMLEVIRQDYIKTARAKGQKETIVIWKHAFRNTLIPVIAGIGGGLEGMMGGASQTAVRVSNTCSRICARQRYRQKNQQKRKAQKKGRNRVVVPYKLRRRRA